MYGSIARLHPQPGRYEELVAYGEHFSEFQVPGFLASYLFKPDQDPYGKETAFLVAVFADAASYRANADSPEQHQRYLALRALLVDDPDWMDGTFEQG